MSREHWTVEPLAPGDPGPATFEGSYYRHRGSPKKPRLHACRLPGHVFPTWSWWPNSLHPGRGLFGRPRLGDLWRCRCDEEWLFAESMGDIEIQYGAHVWWRRSAYSRAGYAGATTWEREIARREIRL